MLFFRRKISAYSVRSVIRGRDTVAGFSHPARKPRCDRCNRRLCPRSYRLCLSDRFPQSPRFDIIGASSGASVGAAFGILFLPGAVAVTLSAFAGAICCVLLALTLSSLTAEKDGKSIVLSGIAVHSLAQTALVCLKLLADPEKQLASIEYWIMGSLNGISLYSIGGNIALCLICLVGMFLLYRQILLLSLDDQEGRLLGVNVTQIRLIVLLIATLAASSVISMTGLISFISLLAPHGARLLFKNNRLSTMLFSGLLGGCLLTLGDIFARSIASTELPVSIFTSLLGAPFLIYLCIRRKPLQ